MPDMITGAIAGGGQAVSGLLGSSAAKKASRTEAQAAQDAIDLQRETRDLSLANLRPYLQAGTGALSKLQSAADQQLDPSKFYGEYFQSPEYAQLSDQASRNILASREATGGLRTTSSANLLGSIAPQLAQSAFARQQALQDAAYNRQMGVVNVGLNAAGGSNAAAGNAASNIGNLMLQKGQAVAGGQAVNAQAVGGLLNNLTSLFGAF
jgi:hypothetical protein